MIGYKLIQAIIFINYIITVINIGWQNHFLDKCGYMN